MKGFDKMNMEEITKEDILNVTGSMFDTMLDYVDNSNNELEKLQQALNEIEKYINEFPSIKYASVEKINGKRLSGKLIPVDDLLEIINKAKKRIEKAENE